MLRIQNNHGRTVFTLSDDDETPQSLTTEVVEEVPEKEPENAEAGTEAQ